MNNIKKLCLIILIIAFSFNSRAQDNFTGKVLYKTYYPDKKQRNVSTEVPLFFNSKESISIRDKIEKPTGDAKMSNGNVTMKLPYGDAQGGQIYRNIKDSTIINRRPKNAISEAFIVKELWVDIEWNILSKTKKIGNYNATKAKGSFRGRDYTVWFTYDIPVPFGPWKLHGLPGLILEAEDSEKMMRFYAIEIKIPFDTKEIIKIPTAENEITHKEEVYMQDNFTKLLVKKLNARRPKGQLPARANPNRDGRKYRPEKTYEWETETVDEKKN